MPSCRVINSLLEGFLLKDLTDLRKADLYRVVILGVMHSLEKNVVFQQLIQTTRCPLLARGVTLEIEPELLTREIVLFLNVKI